MTPCFRSYGMLVSALVACPALAQGHPYRLCPESHFDVVTHKAGMLGFVGHEHRIRAHGVTAAIFGIRPFSQVGGMVKVADRVAFEVDAIAVPSSP